MTRYSIYEEMDSGNLKYLDQVDARNADKAVKESELSAKSGKYIVVATNHEHVVTE